MHTAVMFRSAIALNASGTIPPHRAGERGTVKSRTRSAKDDTVRWLHVQFDTAVLHTLTDIDPNTVKKL